MKINRVSIFGLIFSIFVLFWASNQESFARLVSGVVAHNHSSATSGGSSLNPVSLSAHDHSSGTSGGVVLNTPILNTPVLNSPELNTAEVTSGGLTVVGNVDVTGAISISSNFTSSKSCASGYTRITPNLCLQTGATSSTALTRDACTTIAAPSGAKAVWLEIFVSAHTANAISVRQAQVGVHDTSGCTTAAGVSVGVLAREEVAAANTNLAEFTGPTFAVVFSGNFFLKFTDDTGNNGTATYSLRGYYD